MAVDGQTPSSDDLAQCIAAHFLNPNIKTPITVGITGGCSEGVTSLMNKIEAHLLVTAAQAAFPHKDFSGEGMIRALSEQGKRIANGVVHLLAQQKPGEYIAKEQEKALVQFLEEYRPEHEAVYKSLACIELKQLVKEPEHESKEKSLVKDPEHDRKEKSAVKDPERDSKEKSREIPRVLTVKFSARDYRGTLEASDGLQVEIAEAIEISMTRAQRWTTRCRHNRQSLFDIFDLLIPALVFAAWTFIDRFNVSKLKYGAIPASVIAFAASALKKFRTFCNWKQVSKFVNDHLKSRKSDQYGQQQTVISKIKFLKKESGKKPWPVFSFFSGENLKTLTCLLEEKIEKTPVPKYGSAPHEKLRIIVFLEGLEHYEDSVIVRVMQSLSTLVKACEINFVLALDKNIIRKAFKSSSQKEDDADYFISQIIELPVTLLHPAVESEINSEMQGNTINDIEKQLISRSESKKCVSRVQDMSMMTNNLEESVTFKKLNCFAREISGLHQNYIKYHNFARNVISQTMDPATKTSWQWDKELVAWIFICFQWRQEINILIQDWHAYIDVKDKIGETKQEPSLKEIVANYIKHQVDSKENKKNAIDAKEKEKKEFDSEEEKKEKWNKLKVMFSFGDAVFNFEENQFHGNLPRWKSLYKALSQVQDVSMKGIQCFQHFRFHCDTGYLNLPRDLS
ncbi:uncharacterized protein LOC131044137 [Cryptomeria japonica]|uniref:uncharacterized protein LOC131044137 n=1 Tax=Cryptomeria japonica TaxID=3369 RepID=UPI0027DA66E9|nr:uncharacterized protein LOC131044137 [Cryptomeria japonica]XP_057833380.2 uncharacterized protein LOC131044137 [Cryptomeria japonica]